jgi:hypothetical protein
MNEVSAAVEATAELIKGHFARMKADQQGKPYRPHERFRKYELWVAAAEMCNELKADPFDFVRAAFTYCTVPGGPFPQMLCGNAARHWYKDHQRALSEVGKAPPTELYKTEIVRMFREVGRLMVISKQRPSDFLLDDCMLPLHVAPAFCRVLILPKDTAVMKTFGKKARSEIIGNQKLLSVLGELGMDLSWLERLK